MPFGYIAVAKFISLCFHFDLQPTPPTLSGSNCIMSDQTEPFDQKESQDKGDDSLVDALAATALVIIFVIAAIYWISGQ